MTATDTKDRASSSTQAAPASQSTAVATQPLQPQAIAIIDGVEVPSLIRERDDELMLAAFMGEVVDTWFYEFEIAGKKVEGVGVIGADEFARIQAERGCPITVVPYGISIVEVARNDERGVQATVVMRDARTRRESVGVAFYPYWLKKKNGEKVYDDKADRKALSVAKRNAILDLIPQEEILAVLKARKQLIAQNKVRLEGVRQRAIAAAPAVTAVYDAQAERQRDPYTDPVPLQSTRAPQAAAAAAAPPASGVPATEEQIARLLDLVDDTRVNQETKDHVQARLKRGITQATAAKWIADLERAYPPQNAEESDELPLAAAGAR